MTMKPQIATGEPKERKSGSYITVYVSDLYVRCSFPMRPDVLAASDTCQAHATASVADRDGNRWYRCEEHEGMLDDTHRGAVWQTVWKRDPKFER